MPTTFTNFTLDTYVSTAARAAGYTPAEIKAGLEHSARAARRVNPPGHFDSAGRFFAQERTQSVETCRKPSRAWPYPEMNAARTAEHCAEVFSAEELIAVKRVGTLRKALGSKIGMHLTAHEQIQIARETVRVLKAVKRTDKLVSA